MERWWLFLSAFVTCSHAAKILSAANASVISSHPQAQFYLVASRPVKLNLTTCSPPSPPTCALNDQEAAYVVHRAVLNSGYIHVLLNARTVRTEFALQAAGGQLSGAAGRQAVLDRSAAILANTTSALLERPLSFHEVDLAALTIARNVPSCVKLNEATVRDMWTGFVYRQAQQVNFTASDPIGQFAMMSVLFLAQDDKPVNRPDPLKFAQFVRVRLERLVGNMCTEVPKRPTTSPQLVPLPKERRVLQLVTVWKNGTITVKEVAPSKVVKGIPFAPIGDGSVMVQPTVG